MLYFLCRYMQDKFWNKIRTRKGKRWVYYELHLTSWYYNRSLWYMDEDWVFRMKRNTDIHLFYKLNSYGFNSQLLNSFLDEKTPIVLSIKWLLRKFILRPERIRNNQKSYLNFVSEWFELQVFVPFDIIEQNKFYWDIDYAKYIEDYDKAVEEVVEDTVLDWKELAKDL